MAISSGIYSLAGVLIGGGITTGGQLVLEKRRERRDERAERRTVIAAKRQVAAELFGHAIAFTQINDDPASGSRYRYLLEESEQWKRYGALLAQDHSFLAVQRSYMHADVTVRALDAQDLALAKTEAKSGAEQVYRAVKLVDEEDMLGIGESAANDADTPPPSNP